MADEEDAKNKIAKLEATVVRLEDQLKRAKTLTDEDTVQTKLTKALERLEVLERKYQPSEPEEEEEEEDGDNNQCPQCGHELTDFGDGTYHCAGCGEYFEETE